MDTCTVEVISRRPKERNVSWVEAAVHTLVFPVDNINDTDNWAPFRETFQIQFKRQKERRGWTLRQRVSSDMKVCCYLGKCKGQKGLLRLVFGRYTSSNGKLMCSLASPTSLQAIIPACCWSEQPVSGFSLGTACPCFQFPFCRALLFSFLQHCFSPKWQLPTPFFEWSVWQLTGL